MKRKVLVIGAAGHVGNALTRALVEQGCEVTAAGRRPNPPVNLAGLQVTYRPGDADAAGQFDHWIEGQDLVVDAAAPYPLRAYPLFESGPNPIAKAHKRTAALIAALMRQRAELVYISSFVTCVRPLSGIQRFQAGLARLTHPYFEVKSLIEQQILDAARRGLRAVIVNPTYCLGPWDLHDRAVCMIPLTLNRELSVTSNQIIDVIDVRDVALAALKALELKTYAKPLVLGAQKIRIDELHSLICEIGGVAPPAYTIPKAFAAIGAYWLDFAMEAIGANAAFSSSAAIMAAMFEYLPDSSNQLGALGIVPRPLTATIADAMAWYRHIDYC